MSFFSVLKSIITLPYRAIKACIDATTNFIRSIFNDEAEAKPVAIEAKVAVATEVKTEANVNVSTPVNDTASVITPLNTTGASNFVYGSKLVSGKGGKLTGMAMTLWAKFNPITVVRVTANANGENLINEPFTLNPNSEYRFENTNPDIRSLTIHTNEGDAFVCHYPVLSRSQRKLMRKIHANVVVAA